MKKSPEAVSGSPSHLVYDLHAFSGPTTHIELRGDQLVVVRHDAHGCTDPDESPRTTTPTPVQWQAFRALLDRIGAWSWQGRYEPSDPGILDGPGWELEIDWAGKRIRTEGYCAFPGDELPPGKRGRRAFDHFLNDLFEMAGLDPES